MQGVEKGELISIAGRMIGMTPSQAATFQLGHLEGMRPYRLSNPPPDLARAIEHTRTSSGMRLADDSRRGSVFDGYRNDTEIRRQLSAYREQLTWEEACNARRLSALAWCWSNATDDVRREFEGVAVHHWRLSELRIERGWAERICKSYDRLPTMWREL